MVSYQVRNYMKTDNDTFFIDVYYVWEMYQYNYKFNFEYKNNNR